MQKPAVLLELPGFKAKPGHHTTHGGAITCGKEAGALADHRIVLVLFCIGSMIPLNLEEWHVMVRGKDMQKVGNRVPL